jgi:hypothetical protein
MTGPSGGARGGKTRMASTIYRFGLGMTTTLYNNGPILSAYKGQMALELSVQKEK